MGVGGAAVGVLGSGDGVGRGVKVALGVVGIEVRVAVMAAVGVTVAAGEMSGGASAAEGVGLEIEAVGDGLDSGVPLSLGESTSTESATTEGTCSSVPANEVVVMISLKVPATETSTPSLRPSLGPAHST